MASTATVLPFHAPAKPTPLDTYTTHISIDTMRQVNAWHRSQPVPLPPVAAFPSVRA